MPKTDTSILQRYAEFRPTGFDPRGLNTARMGDDPEDPDRSEWLVAPCSITRDSDSLDQSNWNAQAKALAEIDPDERDHETHRFGHWACGWLEIVIVRPGSKAAETAVGLSHALEGYPVLDVEDLSERECDAQMEAWDNYAQRDVERDIGSLFDVGDYGNLAVEWDGAELFRYLMDRGVLEGNGDDISWSKVAIASLDPFELIAHAAETVEGRKLATTTHRAEPDRYGWRKPIISPVLSRRQRAIVNRAIAEMPEQYTRRRR